MRGATIIEPCSARMKRLGAAVAGCQQDHPCRVSKSQLSNARSSASCCGTPRSTASDRSGRSYRAHPQPRLPPSRRARRRCRSSWSGRTTRRSDARAGRRLRSRIDQVHEQGSPAGVSLARPGRPPCSVRRRRCCESPRASALPTSPDHLVREQSTLRHRTRPRSPALALPLAELRGAKLGDRYRPVVKLPVVHHLEQALGAKFPSCGVGEPRGRGLARSRASDKTCKLSIERDRESLHSHTAILLHARASSSGAPPRG